MNLSPEEKVSELQGWLRDALAQIKNLQAELATAQLRVAGLEAALKQKDNIQDRSDADAAEIGRLESQHERKDKYVLELEAKLQGAMALNSENEKLSGQVSDLADERDKYANTILSLRSQLTEAQKLISDNHLVIEGLGEDLKEANAKLAEAQKDIGTYQRRLETALAELEEARLGGSK